MKKAAFTLNVEESDHGLWFITSTDAEPALSTMFVAAKSLEEALSAVPRVLADLLHASKRSTP